MNLEVGEYDVEGSIKSIASSTLPRKSGLMKDYGSNMKMDVGI